MIDTIQHTLISQGAGDILRAAEDVTADQEKLCVLVADDDATIRQLLKLYFQSRGWTVLLAADGREAVEVYRRHGQDIQVALLDVHMPRLDGPHALAELRCLNDRVACCFMSGFTGDYTAEDLLACGAADVVPKPFQLPQLAQVLLRAALEPQPA